MQIRPSFQNKHLHFNYILLFGISHLEQIIAYVEKQLVNVII